MMEINGIQPNSQNMTDSTSANQELHTTNSSTGKVLSEKLEQTKDMSNDEKDLDILDTTEEQLDKKLKDALSMANNKMKFTQPHTRLEFDYHDTVNRVSMKIVDRESGDVVKEIPPEKTIKMLEKLWEVAGLLFDEKL